MIDPDDFPNDWYGWLTNQCGHIGLELGAGIGTKKFAEYAKKKLMGGDFAAFKIKDA